MQTFFNKTQKVFRTKKSLNFKRQLAGFTCYIIIFILIIAPIFPLNISARTSVEIAQDIINQQNALNQSRTDLENAQKNLDYYSSSFEGTKTGIPAIEEEIKKLEAELEFNKIQLELYEQNRNLKELEKLQREITRTNSVRSSYMDWRTTSNEGNKLIREDFDAKRNDKTVNCSFKQEYCTFDHTFQPLLPSAIHFIGLSGYYYVFHNLAHGIK